MKTTEEYNGTTWAGGGDLGTAKIQLAGCAADANDGLSFGGLVTSTASAITEEYNGTSWSVGGNLATARNYLGGAGVPSTGLSFGGYDAVPNNVVTTEEYTITPPPTAEGKTLFFGVNF